MKYVTLYLLCIFLLFPVGCIRNTPGGGGTVSPPPASSFVYIKSLRLSYSTSKSLIKFDENRTETPFPENTKGVVLRISGDNVPEDAVITVTWYFLGESKKSLCVQKVLPEELNRLQYVDLSLYHQEAEFPKGDYEVVIEDKEKRLEKLVFSVL